MLIPITLTEIHSEFGALGASRYGGATKPWIAVGRREDGTRIKLIVKFSFDQHYGGHHFRDMLVCEYVCSTLFSKLGIPVAPAYVASLPPLLLGQIKIRHPLLHEKIANSTCPHFATEFQENMSDIQGTELLSEPAHLSAAADILTGDTLVLNADRRKGNGNLLYNASKLLAIDHGLAFAALRLGASWEMLPPSYLTEHLCYYLLTRKRAYTPDFSRIFGQWVEKMSVKIIDEMSADVPECWKNSPEHFDSLLAHLRKHDTRLDRIAKSLKETYPSPQLTAAKVETDDDVSLEELFQ